MLEELGYETLGAENGVEGLNQLQGHPGVRLALVDWNMPEMNGYEFVCAVRKDPAFDGVMLMMVTTETEMSQVVKALEAGANEYVMKPFTKEVIAEKLGLLGMEVG
jgi:two-component system chemotaxis response regulator CheY